MRIKCAVAVKSIAALIMSLTLCSILLAAKEKSGPIRINIQANAERVRTILIERMLDEGAAIDSETSHRISFSKDAGDMAQIVMGLAITGVNTSRPELRAEFNILEKDGETLISGHQEVRAQTGFGQTRIISLDGGKARKKFSEFMEEIKASAEAENPVTKKEE